MTRALLFGAVIGLVWVLLGLPVAVPTMAVTATVTQPLVLAFTAGLLARPRLTRGRTT